MVTVLSGTTTNRDYTYPTTGQRFVYNYGVTGNLTNNTVNLRIDDGDLGNSFDTTNAAFGGGPTANVIRLFTYTQSSGQTGGINGTGTATGGVTTLTFDENLHGVPPLYIIMQSTPDNNGIDYFQLGTLPTNWTATAPASTGANLAGMTDGSGITAYGANTQSGGGASVNTDGTFASSLIGVYKGIITIRDENGDTIATVRWEGFNNPGDTVLPPTGSPCFTKGTQILMADGTERPVEDLEIGDIVKTKDNGGRVISWVGSSALNEATLQQFPEFRPMTIPANTLGTHDALTVSPQHQVVLETAMAEVLFGLGAQVLASAKSLAECSAAFVEQDYGDVEYFHVMFDDHEIIRSNGLWTESFNPGKDILTRMGRQNRDEIVAIFPELDDCKSSAFESARPKLKPKEVKVLLNR